MSESTTIQWTDATINFWWGCTKVSPACTHCYAEEMGRRFGPLHFGQPVLWGAGKPRFERLQAAREEALKLERKAVKKERRYRVFVNSMSDWLDDEVPIEWLAFLLETIFLCTHLDFQLLTKRPEHWRKRVESVLDIETTVENPPYPDEFFEWVDGWLDDFPERLSIPDNIWIGCTAENQAWADKRIPHLLKIPAKVRFLSCEPLCGHLNFIDKLLAAKYAACEGRIADVLTGSLPEFQWIHWVIAGGESGGKAVPSHPDWFRSLRDQCAAAGVAFFFKQWGEWISLDNMQSHMDRRAYRGEKIGPEKTYLALRVGVKIAGNLLDGVRHEAFPDVSQ